MKRGTKAQLFTLDLLLALIPLTIALGMSANAISGVATQIEDYTTGYGTKRVATDAADVLIKTAGESLNWENDTTSLRSLGFALRVDMSIETCPDINTTLDHVLDASKLSAFNGNLGSSTVSSALRNLSGGLNVRIKVESTSTSVDVVGYQDGGSWVVTNDTGQIASVMANASDIFVIERGINIREEPIETATFNWSFSANAIIDSTPIVADIDNDGDMEVVVGSQDGNVYAYDSTGTQIWSYTTGGAIWISSPVTADIDGDGYLEIAIGSSDNNIYLLEHDGTLKWSYSTGDDIWVSPAIEDIDEDGDLDVVAGSFQADPRVIVLDKNGSLIWDYLTSFRLKGSVGVSDIDNDGNWELVSGNCDTYVYALNHDGTLLWKVDPGGGGKHIHSSPGFADVDEDGKIEVIIGTHSSNVYALNGEDGSVLWSYTTGDKIDLSSPAIGDIDGDGKLEVAIGSKDNYLYVLNGEDGSLLWRYATGGAVQSSPAIADTDGDGKLEVIVGSEDNSVYTFNGEDGSLQWSYATGGKVVSSPIAADLDGDGYLEVIFGSEDMKMYVIDVGGRGTGWPIWGYDNRRSRLYTGKSLTTDCDKTIEQITEDTVQGTLKVYIWR